MLTLGRMTDADVTRPARDAQLAQLAAGLLSRVESYGTDLAHVVRAGVRFYRDVGIVEFEQLEQSCTANLRYVFDAIAGSADASPTSRCQA